MIGLFLEILNYVSFSYYTSVPIRYSSKLSFPIQFPSLYIRCIEMGWNSTRSSLIVSIVISFGFHIHTVPSNVLFQFYFSHIHVIICISQILIPVFTEGRVPLCSSTPLEYPTSLDNEDILSSLYLMQFSMPRNHHGGGLLIYYI